MDNYLTITTPHSSELALFRRIRLRAQRRVLWLRHLWSGGATPLDVGMAISHDEVDRLLVDPIIQRAHESDFYANEPAAQKLTIPIFKADEEAKCEKSLNRLQTHLGLTDRECDLLSLIVAAEVEPSLRRVYGYLNDDAAASYPTPLLAAQLFSWPEPMHFSPTSGLARWLLARPDAIGESAWSLNAPWVADPLVRNLVVDGIVNDPVLGDAAFLMDCERIRGLPSLYAAELTDMRDFIVAMNDNLSGKLMQQRCKVAAQVEVIGPEGSGRATLAGQVCAALNSPLIIADAASLLRSDIPANTAAEQVHRVSRLARLSDAFIYWRSADSVDPCHWKSGNDSTVTLLGTTSPLPSSENSSIARKTIRLKTLAAAQRKVLWASLSSYPLPAPVADWLLTPAAIGRAAAAVAGGEKEVANACKSMPRDASGVEMAPLPCPYIWDDLVLPPGLREHLEELETQARLRWPVYEEWGFGRLCPIGRGIAALFTGPSGTGKTMAAQVIARSLDMELYRVDLASVVSKYIGETEKNLKRVFDACDHANVLLFFDEADALFGQRTQVKDAHDRFANIEIDYLLQRMEQFDGIAIMATNRKGDIDKAFLRRFRFLVDFVPPRAQERLIIWKLSLPNCSPNGEQLTDGIDYTALAEKLNMTGADIKSTALAAAFLAYSEDKRISMRHVWRAAHRELAKHGLALRESEG